jgi:hypothetical protein
MSAYARPGYFPGREPWRNGASRCSPRGYGRRDGYRGRPFLGRPLRIPGRIPSPLEDEIESAIREAKRTYRPIRPEEWCYR